MNLSTFNNLGINPVGTSNSYDRLKLETLLTRKSMIEFIERYEWKNLPPELTQDLIERILFFRGKGCLFKGIDEKFRFLPFTLKGRIDLYGRYVHISPVLFSGSVSGDKEEYIPQLELAVAYSVEDEGETVILTDASLAISQDNPYMYNTLSPLIEQLVDILVLVNIDLVSSAKVFYLVATDEAQKKAIEAELQNLDINILNGKRAFVVVSPTELQPLQKEASKDSVRYFQSYQSFDNLRKDILGIPNGGTFMKQEHMTEAESSQNGNSGSQVYKNGLRMRKEFCAIANKLFGLQLDVVDAQPQADQIVEEYGSQTAQKEEDNANL